MFKIEIKFITLIRKKQRLFLLHVISFIIIILCYNSLVFSQEVPTVMYDRKIFISVDYTFNNEGLYKPYQIREIPKTREKVVLDFGNVCFYVFSHNGKFIRKIGRVGQGPGDMLIPTYFDVDANGDIYVYEHGNKRISIFAKNGKFINSFRVGSVSRPNKANLFVTQEREILINIPSRGYFITVFSRDGEVLQEIGEIPNENSDPSINAMMSSGTPFKHKDGNYYIFLEALHIVKIFNESGVTIREKKLDEIFSYLPSKKNIAKSINDLKRLLVYVSETKITGVASASFFWDIIYRNNKIYVLPIRQYLGSEIDENQYFIFVLNEDLEIERKIILPLNVKLQGPGIFIYKNCFEVLPETEDVLFPFREGAEIYLFTKNH